MALTDGESGDAPNRHGQAGDPVDPVHEVDDVYDGHRKHGTSGDPPPAASYPTHERAGGDLRCQPGNRRQTPVVIRETDHAQEGHSEQQEPGDYATLSVGNDESDHDPREASQPAPTWNGRGVGRACLLYT